ncbi:hypothetical protein ACS0TY_014094 [Phlomoides rotata]
MAGAEPSSQSHPHSNSKLTPYVVVCWIFAAFGGLMFGYDIAISGGISAMDDFLKKFFPTIYERKDDAMVNNYCKYDDQLLQLFTSSLYFAALSSSFLASKACSMLGRRPTIRFASLVFITASLVSGSAPNIFVLIIGRVLFGIGVGFGNESVPLFLSEVAPPHHRGAVHILFQLFITIGILNANLVNYAVSNIHPYGWRLALGLSGFPSLVLFIGSTVIMETPSSLIERGYEKEGRETLQKIRGVDDVEHELQQIKTACERAKKVKHPYHKLLKRESVPPVVISVLIQVFQQLTGINAILFYSPLLYRAMGFKMSSTMVAAVVAGIVNLLSTVFAIMVMDKVGRRRMLLQACVQMFICMVGLGAVLEVDLKGTGRIDKGSGTVVVGLVCLFMMSFAWSWGPLGWVISSEIFPLETRNAGFAVAVSTNMLFTFIIGQGFLSMLCHMKATVFFFFATWILIIGLFVMFLLPDTKGVPIDDMPDKVWKIHPFWKRFMPKEVKGPQMT